MRLLSAVVVLAAVVITAPSVSAVSTQTALEASLRGSERKHSQQSALSPSSRIASEKLVERLAKLEQKLADGQNAIRHQANVQRIAEETERKTQELADKQRRRDALEKEQTEAASHVTATIAQAHEALLESRRKDISILDAKKAKVLEELMTLQGQLKKEGLRLDVVTKEHTRTTAEVKSMTKTRDKLAGEIKMLRAERKAAKISLNRANKVVEEVEARRKTVESSISGLKAERSTLRGGVKALTKLLDEIKGASSHPQQSPLDLSLSDRKSSDSDAAGCYEALNRVRDHLADLGGTFQGLESLKGRLEDRIDGLHAMIATLTSRAESLDRDRPGPTIAGDDGASSGLSLKDDADAAAGTADLSEESAGAAAADDVVAESEVNDSAQSQAIEAQAAAMKPLQAALDRAERAIDLSSRSKTTGTVTTVQPVDVHVAAPSASPAPSSPPPPPPPAPKPRPPAPDATQQQKQCCPAQPCCHQVLAVTEGEHVAVSHPLQAFVAGTTTAV